MLRALQSQCRTSKWIVADIVNFFLLLLHLTIMLEFVVSGPAATREKCVSAQAGGNPKQSINMRNSTKASVEGCCFRNLFRGTSLEF